MAEALSKAGPTPPRQGGPQRSEPPQAHLVQTNLDSADLTGANLREANLDRANLILADLKEANLCGANFGGAQLIGTDLAGADLTGCRVYGVAAWNLKLERAKQQNLVITPEKEPAITVEGSSLYSMFKDFDPQDFHRVLPVYRYKEPEQLLAKLEEKVISPAEGKVKALEERRQKIEAELNRPR